MLQPNPRLAYPPSGTSELLSPTELFFRAVAIVRRHWLICIAVPVLAMVLAVIYLIVTPPQFTATATMAIDMRKSASLLPGSASTTETPIDNPTVESQVEILKSENISLPVIRDLKLVDDPAFTASSGLGALIGSLRSLVLPSQPYTEFERTRAAVAQFERRLSIKRKGVTFVFEISFTSPDRDQAARIANAVAEAYVVDQLEAKYNATKRAGLWLQDRLKELGKQASDAERAVVEYKSRNNIVDTGGRLMNEQQVAELNSQLAVARANESEARAKLTRIQDVMRLDLPDANVTDALHNDVIIRLRNQYTDLSKRESDLVLRTGPNHQSVINVRNDMADIRKSIREELRRIAAGYQSDYQIAKARLDSIQTSLADVVSQSQVTNQAQVELKELDSAAQSYRTLYDSFLQRYMESVQQQSFPLTEARVVTQATPPLKKSEPKFVLTMLSAMAGGSLIGFAAAWMRDRTDKTLRAGHDVEALLNVSCVSSVPMLNIPSGFAGKEAARKQLSEVLLHPASRYAEAIRAIKMAIDFFPSSYRSQSIGVISAMPGEGKSTIAANLATLAANTGSRAVLVDADLRNPTLTGKLAPHQRVGLSDVLAGRPLAAALVHIDELRCDFLPAVRADIALGANEFTSAANMRALKAMLDELKAHYDYVILDLPPLIPVIDARAAADVIDAFVMVVEWGKTSANSVQLALQASSRIQDKTVGVALNKVDTTVARRYYDHEYPSAASAYYSG